MERKELHRENPRYLQRVPGLSKRVCGLQISTCVQHLLANRQMKIKTIMSTTTHLLEWLKMQKKNGRTPRNQSSHPEDGHRSSNKLDKLSRFTHHFQHPLAG